MLTTMKVLNSNSAVKKNHYHVILDVAEEENLSLEVYSIPCLYTCYKYLISMFEEKSLKGDVYSKLQRAVLFNKTNKQLDKMSTTSVRKLLPQFQTLVSVKVANGKDLKRKHSQTRTEYLNSTTLARFEKLCKGPTCVPLLLMLDILESGYGSYDHKDKDSHVKFSLTTNTL